jgi:hypothetical protein
MRTPAFVLALVFLAGIASGAEDPAITACKKEYDAIRKNLSSMTAETTEPLDPSAEGGEVRAYRDENGDVRFIKSELLFTSGRKVEEYYYRNGKLIFAVSEEHRYNAPKNAAPKAAGGTAYDPAKTVVTADRCYFSEDKMLRWLKDKKRMSAKSKEFPETEKNVLDASAKVFEQF